MNVVRNVSIIALVIFVLYRLAYVWHSLVLLALH